MDIEKEMKETPEIFWITTDLYVISIVALLLDEEPVLYNRGHTVYFAYKKTDALRSALQQYKDNVPLPCRDLLESVKRIRGNLAIQKTLSEKRS